MLSNKTSWKRLKMRNQVEFGSFDFLPFYPVQVELGEKVGFFKEK